MHSEVTFDMIEQRLGTGYAVTAGEGANISFLVELNQGKKVFYKLARKRVVTTLRKLDKKLRTKLRNTHPALAYHAQNQSTTIEKEVRTLKKWADAGIPTMSLILHDGERLVAEQIKGWTIQDSLREKEDRGLFREVVQTYNLLRKLAYKYDDKDFLHSDPHPQNFMESNGVIMPIDPGIVIKDEMSLPEVDTRINLNFCYKILDNRIIRSPKTYVQMFLESLNPQEYQAMKDLNAKYPLYTIAILTARDFAVNVLKKKKLKIPKLTLGNFKTLDEMLSQ